MIFTKTVMMAVLLAASTEPAAPSNLREAMPLAETPETIFKAGLAAYDAQNYQRALTLFEEAYRRFPKPEILFDIAQSRTAMGDCARALETLDDLIRSADTPAPLRARAENRKSEIGSCGAAAGAEPPPDKEVKTPTAAAATAVLPTPMTPAGAPPAASPAADGPLLLMVTAPPDARSSSAKSICFATAGTGLTLAITALAFGLEARSAAQSVQDAQIWNDSVVQQDERGKTLGSAATDLFLAAGGATVTAAASCAWWLRSR